MRTTPPYRTVLFLAVLLLPLAFGQGSGLAMDKSGCLTCHQYPGLVRPEKPDGFKVFHIDEQRYRKSPHGKVDCRKCHTEVHQVPHVGATRVTCTNGCHLSEKDKQRIKDVDLKTFHAKEKSYITRLADGSSCRVCHGLYPHQSSKLARAFINMHIGFMICETCHIKRDKFKTLRYDWTSSEAADFAGKPFGSRFNPNLSDAAESTHFISRIAVFVEENGQERLMLNTWDTEKATAFLKEEKQLAPAERKARLEYFHRDIHAKEISRTCDECHSHHSILDFKALGFTEKKATDLVYLNIKGLVTKYKVFYFPEMFQR